MGWAVAGAAGVAFSAFIVWATATEPQIFNIGVDDLGISQPASLFQSAKQEGKITFKPEELQQVRVCEYRLIQGNSTWELAIEYLDEYDMCFITNQLGKRNLIVRPYSESGLITEHGGVYYCKCSSDTIIEDQSRLQ